MESSMTLTIYFDGQFWIGLFEKRRQNKLSVSKFIFGGEPKDEEVSYIILYKWNDLKFSPHVVEERKELPKNPKVLKRKVKALTEQSGIGTKSQQAIKLQIEQRKVERKTLNKEQREVEKDEKFAMRQEKKKEKRKGH